jgi:hypothetical protein
MLPNTNPEVPDDLAVNKEDKRSKVAVTVIGNAKTKNARLRLLKERNENYLAEQRDEQAEEELTQELRVSEP